MDPDSKDLTLLIQSWQDGNRDAGDALMEKIYPELKKLARAYLNNERVDHTLAPTALVNELYLKFAASSCIPVQNRAHFFALAAQTLRHILVDHARLHLAKKRGKAVRVDLTSVDPALEAPNQDLLSVDEALTRLEELDSRAARVVELRFFGGLSEEEIARVIGVSRNTVQRDWKTARAWLLTRLIPAKRSRAKALPIQNSARKRLF
jgi:RNA polymerase sigma factor (TIGR02999 family)